MIVYPIDIQISYQEVQSLLQLTIFFDGDGLIFIFLQNPMRI
jgi:hypothetical protein